MLKKINSLTPDQELKMAEFRDKWLGIGFSCQPADRVTAVIGVNEAYQSAGMEPPKYIIWLDSPLSGVYGAAILANSQVGAQVGAQVWDQVRAQVGAQVRAQVGAQVWAQVGAQVGAQVRAQVGDQVGAQVRAQVGDQVWDQVGAQVGDQVGAQVRAQVGDQVGDQVWDQVGDQVWAQVRDQVGDQVWAQVRDQVWDQVGAQVRAQVGAQVGAQVRAQVGAQVRAQVGAQVWAQVGAQVGDQVRAQVGAQVWDQVYKAGYGQHDANWLAFYDFFNFLGIVETSKLSGMNKIAQSSGWFWPFKNLCILSERPIHLFRDSSNQLHSENKAALEYKDGFKLFRWHGVTVPQWLIENPELVTVEKIESEQNSEVRRCMMERYGYERYIRDCNAVVVDSCDINHPIVGLRDAKLLVKKVVDDEDIVFVDMLNSTPEPDGSVNRYLIRVDPTAYDGDAALYCHAAAASTWRDELNGEFTFKNWKDYTPEFES